MRILTFSYLKRCSVHSLKQYYFGRHFSNQIEIKGPKCESNLVQVANPWPPDDQDLLTSLRCDMQVLPDFVTKEEEQRLVEELEPYLRKMRYEFDHWDDAIHGFKETERSDWTSENRAVFERVRSVAFTPDGSGEPQSHVHVLDLAPAGHIKPHIDATRYCGEVIAGLCLMSSAVMRLVHEKRPELVADAMLPQRALYIMRGVARYNFTHAVLGGPDSKFAGERVLRGRRLALITRSRPPPVQDDPFSEKA